MQSMRKNETQVVEFKVTDAVVNSLIAKYGDITEIKDKAGYDFVMSGLREHRELRLSIDDEHKLLKSDALAYGRALDSKKNELKALIAPTEENLKTVRKVVDDRKAAEKKAKADAERDRMAVIRMKIADINGMITNLNSMDAEQLEWIANEIEGLEIPIEEYQEFTSEANQVKHDAWVATQTALEARIKLDEEEVANKIEEKRLAAEKKEQEQIAHEQAVAQARIDAANRKIEADRKALEDEKKAEQERKDREAFEKQAAEDAKIEAEHQAKIKAVREEKEAKEKAEAEKLAAERAEKLLPDKEKLKAFANQILKLGENKLELKDQKAKEIYFETISQIMDIERLFTQEIERL